MPHIKYESIVQDWWQTLIVEFHDLIEYDALWIDMNEPANFANGGLDGSGCEANNLNYPPYKEWILIISNADGLFS